MTRTSLLHTLVLAVVPLAASAASAQDVALDPRVSEALAVVETWLDAQRAYEQIPGFSAAVVHDQELVWSGAMGMAHPQRGETATAATLYSICSISKLFTSVAVLQLRDRGLLDLRDPVQKHLPWFTLAQRYEGAAPITVEGILTHSAGLPRESNHPYWSEPDFTFPTHEEIVDGLAEQETLYPPWKYFQYSNLGLTLAGEIVAAVSGRPYADYVQSEVLAPLGLHDTHPEIPAEHAGGRLATGYGAPTRDGTRHEVALFQTRGIAPAAGFASTAEDLARFASWQFRLTGERSEVLSAHTLAEMQRVHYVDPAWNTFWGLGFSISRRGERTFVGHGGSCPGFRSQLTMQNDDRIATVFMANAMVNAGTYTNGMYDLVAEAIRAASAGEGGEGPGPDSEQTVDLTPYVGTYSAQPWGSETAVVRWKGGLAFLSLPTDQPLRALTRLRHDSGDTFYRVRDDGERGEDVIFHRDGQGRVTHYTVFGNRSARIR